MADLENRLAVHKAEAETNEVILANGAASLTFTGSTGRADFENCLDCTDICGSEQLFHQVPLPLHRLPTPCRARRQ